MLDLGVERKNEPLYIRQWKYMYVGDCCGEVNLKFDDQGWINPEEFEKLTDIRKFHYLHIENTVQEGEELVIYYEEKKHWWE